VVFGGGGARGGGGSIIMVDGSHRRVPERQKEYENEAWFHPCQKVLIRLTVSCHDPVNERVG
jgi:hypothetical protein